jgi:hypothetical protein
VCTIGSTLTSSFGHKLHDGCWIMKWLLFILMHFASVFVPVNALINYSYVQSFGAAVFLLVQIVLLIDFCYDAADWFKTNGFQRSNHGGDGGDVKPCWGALIVFVLAACLSAIIAMLVLGFMWFTNPVSNAVSTSDASCGFNSFVLGFAVVLFIVGAVLQILVLSRSRNGSIVTAFFIGTYCMWNVFSGLLASKVCQSQVQVLLRLLHSFPPIFQVFRLAMMMMTTTMMMMTMVTIFNSVLSRFRPVFLPVLCVFICSNTILFK